MVSAVPYPSSFSTSWRSCILLHVHRQRVIHFKHDTGLVSTGVCTAGSLQSVHEEVPLVRGSRARISAAIFHGSLVNRVFRQEEKNMDTKKPSLEPVLRKRKTHRKSRSGCRNCKLRRVKCDETRPACRNCIGLLVICNYDSTTPSQASLSSTDIRDDDLKFSIFETNLANDALVTVLNRMVDSQYPQTWDSNKFRALGKHDIDRLNRWHTRTVFTLGPDLMSLCYQLTVSKDATRVRHSFILNGLTKWMGILTDI